jgi:GT2 family glycosyltransferase
MSSVDVIVPCYCYGRFLSECVESILAQSLRDVRVLIIDDASPDDTAQVAASLVQADSRVTCLRHLDNKGHIATYNEGIAWATGDYLLLLSADDFLLPGALRRAVAVLDAYPYVGMVMGKAIELLDRHEPLIISEVTASERPSCRIMSGREFIEFSGCRNRVPTPTAVVRTELQKRLGGYHPDLPHTGDMEMWLRFAAHGDVGIVDAYQAVYRTHANNMSALYRTEFWWADLNQRKAALERFFEAGGGIATDAVLRANLFRLLGVDAISCASGAFNHGNLRASEAIAAFAVALSPDIKKSWQWAKFACKRLIGFKAWSAIRPQPRPESPAPRPAGIH